MGKETGISWTDHGSLILWEERHAAQEIQELERMHTLER